MLGCVNEFLVPDFNEPGLEVIADIETAFLPYEGREALARADASDVAARIALPNEIRRRRGLPPYEGGDVPLVSISLVSMDQLGATLGLGAGMGDRRPPHLRGRQRGDADGAPVRTQRRDGRRAGAGAIPRLAEYLASRPYAYAAGITDRLALDFRALIGELGTQGVAVA